MIYQPSVPLWPGQQEALQRMGDRSAFALLMAMRTGKSATTLANFGQLELEGKADDLCVLAPAGVYRTWLSTLEEHGSPDLRERLLVHTWKSGPRAEALAAPFLAALDRPRLLLMNIEALSLPGVARATIEAFLGARRSYLAIDESTTIKNHKAKRTKYVLRTLAPLTKFRRILTGLPTPRSPLDLFTQFAFLDPAIVGTRSFYVFQRQYAEIETMRFGGRAVNVVVGYKPGAIEQLAELIKPHSFRVQFRSKVPSTYSTREVKLTPEQEKAYEDMRRFATTQLANSAHVTASVVIDQIGKMHRILCGLVTDEEGNEHNIPERRTEALLEELEDYDGKAVIWFTYVRNLEKARAALEKEYGSAAVACFYGGNTTGREEDDRRFKEEEACRFMLGTPGSGGRGRTWSNADRSIYFSSSDNLEHREQSEQRTMGVEKDRGVDNVDLVVPGTVDVKILYAIRNKINMATTINGDNYREWLV